MHSDVSVGGLIGACVRLTGAQADYVPDGTEAWKRLEAEKVAAIVVEVNHRESGLEGGFSFGTALLQKMSAERPELLEKTIVVTTMPETDLSSYESEIVGVLRMPFSTDELIELLRKLL